MRIESLREFIELADSLNFTKAARALNLSQSTLSKHIAALESEMGCRLFDRTESSVRLTRAGRSLYDTAVSITSQMDTALKDTKNLKSEQQPQVIRVDGNIMLSSFTRLFSRVALQAAGDHAPFYFEYHGTRSMSEAPNSRIVDLLADGEIDLACTFLPPDSDCFDRFAYRPLFDEPLVIFANERNPLTECHSLKLEDLSGSIMVMLGLYPDCPKVVGAPFEISEFTSLRTRVIPVGDMLEVPLFLGDLQANEITPLQLTLAKNLDLENAPQTTGLRVLDLDDPRAHVSAYVIWPKDSRDPVIGQAVDLICDVAKQVELP